MQVFQVSLKIVFVSFVVIELLVTCYYTFSTHRKDSTGSRDYLSVNDLFFENNTESVEYLWRPYRETDLHNSSDRIAAQLAWTKKLFGSKQIKSMRRKNILLVYGLTWGIFWSTKDRTNCPGFSINSNKCKLTVSRNLREKHLSPGDFDAIIYTHDYLSPSRKGLKIPEHVKQISFTQESPYISPRKIPKNNLIASYYRGSDIVLPYSKWIAYDSEESKHFNVRPTPSNLLPLKDYSKGKTGLVVVFCSHCGNAFSGRSDYIEELKKYISVNIFGKCGVSPPCKNKDTDRLACVNSVVKKYKFYLSFENSNCRSYITEKFFGNALKNNAVPVVLGAHPDDYTYAAPPNSYISTQDFQSPKDLAEYLITLDKNNTMYNEYFRWKGTGTFYHAWKDLFCRLCGLLFYADFVPPHSFKENTTWDKVNPCLPKGQWYWNSTK